MLAVVLLLLACFWLGTPDAAFRSSDAKWADYEIGLKGRRLDTIAVNFEHYKLSCAVPHAVLLRTTPRHWMNVFAWPNYLTDRKWRVPYADPVLEIGDYYPLVNAKNCATEGWTDANWRSAKANAHRFLGNL